VIGKQVHTQWHQELQRIYKIIFKFIN